MTVHILARWSCHKSLITGACLWGHAVKLFLDICGETEAGHISSSASHLSRSYETSCWCFFFFNNLTSLAALFCVKTEAGVIKWHWGSNVSARMMNVKPGPVAWKPTICAQNISWFPFSLLWGTRLFKEDYKSRRVKGSKKSTFWLVSTKESHCTFLPFFFFFLMPGFMHVWVDVLLLTRCNREPCRGTSDRIAHQGA